MQVSQNSLELKQKTKNTDNTVLPLLAHVDTFRSINMPRTKSHEKTPGTLSFFSFSWVSQLDITRPCCDLEAICWCIICEC